MCNVKWSIFCSMLYQYRSLFQMQISEPSETKPAIWKPSATSSQVRTKELGEYEM